ncbi:MAG: single-stranded DNA-binding protein, partial [Spirochaetales bacterium]|nr:single-stranded DNA-binding protein [Spirochaetales bacterium]
PGPWGMSQTGIPFGEIEAVRDWMGIEEIVERPLNEHPKRPIQGFACRRSEVSGRRLWGLFSGRYETPERFFRDHFVINYCPLAFMAESGRNITPDKLPASERARLFALCDAMLAETIRTYKPRYLVGVGQFARRRFEVVAGEDPSMTVTHVLHPSPASPAANRGWAEKAHRELRERGVWREG